MHPERIHVDWDGLVQRLREAGAHFAFLHGSRVAGGASAAADFDVAARFGAAGVDVWSLHQLLPGGVDLLVLDGAPLELAGRVALHGRLLFEDDPPARVAWQATLRKIYLDEQPRIAPASKDFARC